MDRQLDIKLNPHPTRRYELIVTVNAPGPVDRVTASADYVVGNETCTPYHSFEGLHDIPNTHRSIELTRMDEKTWKGYFYFDLLQDADYFGLGTCRWEIATVGPSFVVHGLTFSAGIGFFDAALGRLSVPENPVTQYFPKREFIDQTMSDSNTGGAMLSSVADKSREWFPVTIAVKEVKP
jgi:hypothetical protein